MDVGDVLRVSVVGGRHRVDLVVPAAVAVAELLPELARRLDPSGPLAGRGTPRLSLLGGPGLDPGLGLAAQGVPDGAVLTVTEEGDHVEPVDDDLTAVVAEVVETLPRPGREVVARAALTLSTALLGLAALGVLADGSPSAAVGVVVTTVLLGVAAVSRGTRTRWVAPAAAWLAVLHAAAAAAAAGLVAAGVAAVVAGGIGAVVVRDRRGVLWAGPVGGAVLAVTGVVGGLVAALPVAATAAVVLVVVTGDLVPWLAAALAGLVAPPLGEQPPRGPDRDAVSLAVRRAHHVLLTCSVATGLLLATLGPVVAGQGRWGVGLVLLCCTVVALRSRRQRVGRGGPTGLLGALAALLPLAAHVWWTTRAWRPDVAAVAAGAGLLVLAALVAPPPRTARTGRWAELAEGLSLVALPPVALAATGLLDVVRELVG